MAEASTGAEGKRKVPSESGAGTSSSSFQFIQALGSDSRENASRTPGTSSGVLLVIWPFCEHRLRALGRCLPTKGVFVRPRHGCGSGSGVGMIVLTGRRRLG